MAASNTKECFRESVGKRIVGVLFDALPSHRPDLSAGNKTVIFDDGTGLTFGSNGAFWQESRSDIEEAVERAREELARRKRDVHLFACPDCRANEALIVSAPLRGEG